MDIKTNDEFENELMNKGIDDQSIDIIKRLYENNKKLFSTINFEFVKSKMFKNIDINLLSRIVSLEITQSEILSLDDKKRELLLFMTNNCSKNSYVPAYFSALLKNLKGTEFDQLVQNINIENLNQKDLVTLSCILTSKKNNLMIISEEQLKNYDKIVNQKILDSLTNNDINSYKDSILLKQFNLSLKESKLLCQKYCRNLEEMEFENAFSDVLKTIKKLYCRQILMILII